MTTLDLRDTIYSVLRDFRMPNMACEDEPSSAYPLVDLVSDPAPADISSGEEVLRDLADEIAYALSSIPEQGVGVKPVAYIDPNALRELTDQGKRQLLTASVSSHPLGPNYVALGYFDALAPSHPAAVAVTDEMVEPDLLAKLGENISLELSWGPWDGEIESECFWRVHQRRGNRNDQEWDLLGYGRTPADAIRRALADRDRVK